MAALPSPIPANDRRMAGDMLPVRIGATGAAMTAPAVLAWAMAARPGDELLWATGSLPKWSKVLPVVRELANRDMVFARCDRTVSPPQYVIRRLDKAWSEPAPAIRIAREIPPRDDDQARLLMVLKAAARKGEPCPCNRVLAVRAGLSDGNRASYLIKCLVADRRIMNEPSPWKPGRIITILPSRDATGVIEGVKR